MFKILLSSVKLSGFLQTENMEQALRVSKFHFCGSPQKRKNKVLVADKK